MTTRLSAKSTTTQAGAIPATSTPGLAARPRRPRSTPVAGVKWLDAPQAHDYPAAASYVSLLAGPTQIRALGSALKAAPVVRYKAKDILRAAGLALLPADDIHVAKDLAQIRAGNPLSPCLMIRGNARRGRQALIADGYHRVCASYYTDEDTDIPVKIVKL
jgi:hypothetical protein